MILYNSWTDESGVMYSLDRKRLLKAPDKLKSYNVKEGTKIICDNAFKGGVNYEGYGYYDEKDSFIDPVDIKNPQYSAMYSIKEVSLPNSIEVIGDNAFFGCVNLESINIPNGVRYIGDSAFCACIMPESIIIPESVKIIDHNSFLRCHNLNTITLPGSVTMISDDAFEYCNNLSSIIIPNGTREYYEKLLPIFKEKLVEQ